MKKILLTLSGAALLCTQACVKDDFNFDKLAKGSWDPEIAVPLAYASVTIQDIIDTTGIETTVQVDPVTNFCTIVYSGNIFSKKASEIVQIPSPQTANFSQFVVVPGSGTASVTQTMSFQSGTTTVDTVTFRTLNYVININNGAGVPGNITVTIPAAKKNGVAFTNTFPLASSVSKTFDLSGYSFDMTRAGTTNNEFDVVYTLQSTATAPLSGNFSVGTSMENIGFRKIVGYIGQQPLSPFQDTVVINIFKKAFGTGTFNLIDPTINLKITNSYGLPIQMNFTRFDGYNPNSNPQLITIQGVPSPLNINYPTLAQAGTAQVTTVVLDKNTTNGTIVGALNNNKSSYLIYQPNSVSNPNGPTSTPNFVLDDSQFDLDIDVRLPLWGTAKDFVLEDTIRDFSLDNVGNIDNFLLRAYIKNGFPVDLDVQVYFVDSLFRGPVVNGIPTKAIDSLATSEIFMRSGTIDADGRVTSPSIHSHDYPYDKTRIQKLKDAKHLILRAKASSTNNGTTNVKIFATDKLDLNLGVKTQIHQEF